MSGNFDSWEDAAAQDDDLSRQAQNMNINANSFRPGASSFQPGASSFQPGQQFQQYGGYGQQTQYNQFPQYGQQGGYQQFPQYQQQQQQAHGGQQQFNQSGQFAAYNQSPGSFQPRQGAPISIAKRGGADIVPTAAAATPAAQTAPPKEKTPAAASAPPKAKVLSIGVPAPPKAEPAKTEAKSEAPAPAKKTDTPAAAPAEKAAKVTASKAVEKTKVSGKTSPTPSSGKNSPTPGEVKKGQTAAQLAAQQTADVDESVLSEMYGKEHVNIIFIGHVDAGKSTLGGQLLIQTGMVDERTLEKYKNDAKTAGRETWYISWVMDLNKEERAKGKTIEVGRGFFETATRRYTILDAPGHKTYVPNMLSGASQADVAILVISARKGEFETGFEKGGQTQEHAMLIKTTGAKELVVAVNKMDDPTVEWSKERYDEIVGKLKPFLKKKMGLDSTFLPLSAQTGLGVKERIPESTAKWWKSGPSLLDHLDGMTKIERNVNAPFMMPIGAKYRDLGTMVEGRIEAGVITKTQNFVMMPTNTQVGISALFGETEEEIPHATAGDQIRVRLRNIEEEDILQGFVLCSPKRLVHCVKEFEAQITIVELKSILSAGFNCVLHVHAATEEVTFAQLLHKLEPKTGRKSKRPPPFAAKGQSIIARLQVTSGDGKVCVERYEDYPQLGRFTLRDQGQTIAVGKITKLILEE
jgi:peptide chain release factor subunit 3